MMGYDVASFGIWQVFAMIFWLAIFLVPAWRITQKAGFPGPLALLMLIPLVNIIMVWVFAFIKWPNQKADS